MHQDVFDILERHFGHGAFYLPLETKLYVMEKVRGIFNGLGGFRCMLANMKKLLVPTRLNVANLK
jgi:hypothetical protein